MRGWEVFSHSPTTATRIVTAPHEGLGEVLHDADAAIVDGDCTPQGLGGMQVFGAKLARVRECTP